MFSESVCSFILFKKQHWIFELIIYIGVLKYLSPCYLFLLQAMRFSVIILKNQCCLMCKYFFITYNNLFVHLSTEVSVAIILYNPCLHVVKN